MNLKIGDRLLVEVEIVKIVEDVAGKHYVVARDSDSYLTMYIEAEDIKKVVER